MEEHVGLPPGDPWADRLSEYVDGELSWRERRRLAAHLRGCRTCAATIEELRGLVHGAASLRTDMEPAANLWPGIAARLTPRAAPAAHRRPGATPWRLPRLAPIGGLALVLALVAVFWMRQQAVAPVSRQDVPAAVSARPPASVAAASPETPGDREYDSRVASLEREARRRLTADRRVIEVLEENLATLDVSIANYREALAAAPEDTDLRARLTKARLRKLRVLEQAVTLSSEANN